jgi:putative two-component system response regulator
MNEEKALPQVLIAASASTDLGQLREIIEQGGCNTLATVNSREVLEIAASNQPAFILLSIGMSMEDGYEVCYQLKQDKVTRHIPILFVSERDDEEELLKGVRFSGVGCIFRPFQTEKVLMQVRTYLEMSRLARKNRAL